MSIARRAAAGAARLGERSIPRLAEASTWRLFAGCRGEDPAIFFHPDGERGRSRRRRQERAKAVCAQCPVILECRSHALHHGENFGTWGGMSEQERMDLLTGQTPATSLGS